MSDVEIFEISGEVFMLVSSIIILSIQILLCFKLKKKFLKLIPVILLLTLTLLFSALIFVSDSWDTVGFIFLTIYSLSLLAVCGIGWFIWLIYNKCSKKKSK